MLSQRVTASGGGGAGNLGWVGAGWRRLTRGNAADGVCHLGVQRQRGRGGGEKDGFLWAAASGRAGLLVGGGGSGLER